jgi:hypothetical protein
MRPGQLFARRATDTNELRALSGSESRRPEQKGAGTDTRLAAHCTMTAPMQGVPARAAEIRSSGSHRVVVRVILAHAARGPRLVWLGAACFAGLYIVLDHCATGPTSARFCRACSTSDTTAPPSTGLSAART